MAALSSFTQLQVWKQSHLLAIDVYRVSRKFPKEEMFGLTNQLRRCSVSIPSNIAEGFNRKSMKEKRRFLEISRGSLGELQAQLLIARDVGYVSGVDFNKLSNQSIQVSRLLRAFSRSAG